MSPIGRLSSLTQIQHALCPGTHSLRVPATESSRKRSKTTQHKTFAVGWDPEGILRQPEGGHISRRSLVKEVEKNKELQGEIDRLRLEKEKELQEARQARKAPQSGDEIIEYFLETETGEMQFEAARLRPVLTQDFFSHLSSKISDARFGAAPNEERSAELEGLRDFLEGVLKSLDSRAQELAAPADRMRKLLTASDKRAALHDMAGNNEIDKALLDLLSQNIAAARAAGQPQAADFMQKVRDAAQKFVLVK